jgi:hypothetical protein
MPIPLLALTDRYRATAKTLFGTVAGMLILER